MSTCFITKLLEFFLKLQYLENKINKKTELELIALGSINKLKLSSGVNNSGHTLGSCMFKLGYNL